ncbi:MAG TPA: amidase [Thermoanaerobaculia bacterium]|nr:amidase [Thermoanaerobaculia bacterium]
MRQTASPHTFARPDRRELLRLLSLAGAAGLLPATAIRAQAQPARTAGAVQPLWAQSAAALAEAIRERRATSLEVIDAHLARIAAVNPELNAVVRVLADTARRDAEAADRALRVGTVTGPLHGVPFTIKENIDVAGSPTTEGVPALAQNVPERDHPIVARLRAAGAIPIGRTNLPDFGMRVLTESHLHGLTRNPWDPQRNVGGSSGGEGAALATGMSPLGLGNDIGGSLRNPAHCCGIVALKPTLGRIPRPAGRGSSLAGQLMAVEGPMARHVRDLRIAFRLIAGYDPSDPWSVPLALELEPPAEPIRVAMVPDPSGGNTDPVVAEGVRKAGEALAAAGYRVEEIEPPELPEVARVWGTFLAAEMNQIAPQMVPLMGPNGAKFFETALAILEPAGLDGYTEALSHRHRLAASWQEFQERYPLVLGPVFTAQPFEIGYDVRGRAEAVDVLAQLRFTVAANLLGLPSVALPVGVAEGLPLGCQIVGARFREDLCLAAAEEVEQRLGVITPIDPIAAREV